MRVDVSGAKIAYILGPMEERCSRLIYLLNAMLVVE